MASQLEQENAAEFAVFKKKVKKLAEYKGRGTELISVYIPEKADRSAVVGQLSEEMSQSSNIKSPQTRKNVQGALKKIMNFLKQINFQIPKNGMAVFAGNVSETEGRNDLRLFTVKPVRELKTKLYWCDSEFHLAPLNEMMKPTEIYGLIAMDKREATVAVLSGKSYEIIGKFTSGVMGKFRAGGQSAQRLEHLREEMAKDFYKRVSEKVNAVFVPLGDKLKGIIIAGPGQTKNDFVDVDYFDYRLKKKVLALLDITYTDESGIREMIQRSEQILKETSLIKEKKLLERFLTDVAKTGMGIYGEKEVLEALAFGKVQILLLSEAIDWIVIKYLCNACQHEQEIIVRKPLSFNERELKCQECSSPTIEIIEEIDYLDYMLEKAEKIGAETEIVSTETNEGEQFYKSFHGIGAILRFK